MYIGILIEKIRRDMEQCFANSGGTPVLDDVRNFILEMRGSLVLRCENGTEAVCLAKVLKKINFHALF